MCSSVYILTDDQDLKLGSLEIQEKVQKLLVQEGMVFENAFVTTPVCCPSRYESIASHVRFEFVYAPFNVGMDSIGIDTNLAKVETILLQN